GALDRGGGGRGGGARGGARRGRPGGGGTAMTLALRRPAPLLDPIERIRPITDRDFSLFQALILAEAGIYLAPAKKALLVGRLTKRLRALGLNSFSAYYERIVEQDDR